MSQRAEQHWESGSPHSAAGQVRYKKWLGLLRGLAALVVLLLPVLFVAACGSGGVKEDPLLRLSAEEALTKGKEFLAAGKYLRATDYLSHAFEVEPNSANGREALLLVADAYYLKGGSEGYIRGEAKYRDFLNRFPTSQRSDYVQFQIANCLAKRMRKPDRDQSASLSALAAYEELQQLYPTSEYADQVEEQIKIVKDNLAEHEFVIGRFNLKVGLAAAGISRFERLIESYPDYQEMDKVFFFLGKANLVMEDGEAASDAFSRLRDEYPDSPYTQKIPEGGREDI